MRTAIISDLHANLAASTTISCRGLLLCLPRSLGIIQNEHLRSQPSAILKYAVPGGVVSTLPQPERGFPAVVPDTSSASLSSLPGSMKASTSGMACSSSEPYRAGRHPMTTRDLHAPSCLYLARSSIVSTDSSTALCKKAQVFTSIKVASSGDAVT